MPDEVDEAIEQTRWQRMRSTWDDLRPTVKGIIGAVAIGWGPPAVADILSRIAQPLGINTDELAGFGLGWGLSITIPCSLVAGVLIVYEFVRGIVGKDFLN